MEELQVLDIQFLHGFVNPTIVVLYQDAKTSRHLKTYEIDVKEKDFRPGPWSQTSVEQGATILVPVPMPLGGAILIGEHTISYFNGNSAHTKSISMRPSDIQACCRIDSDGSRYLLSDLLTSTLFVVVLEHDSSRVLGLAMQPLGQVGREAKSTPL